MESLKVLIAEDSRENIETLLYLLEKYKKQLDICDVVSTLDQLAQVLETNTYDVAFLDIQFKKGNVFSVLDKAVLSGMELPEIIFVTAHGSFEYATKAIQFACLDFVNKPIDPQQLDDIVSKLIQKKDSKEEQKKQLEFLLDLLSGDMNKPASLAVVKPKGVIKYLDLEKLLYVNADKTTSVFYTSDEKIFSTRHLGYYIDLLSGNTNFVQISRSCLVNTDHIKNYNPKTRIIKLDNESELTVSHRYNKKFRESLKPQQGNRVEDVINKIKGFFG